MLMMELRKNPKSLRKIKIPTLSEATTDLDTVHRFLLGHENSST